MAASLPSFAQGLHVLLVDRNSIFLAFMTSMLQHYSYKVTTAKLASTALSMIWEQNLQFNLVMADVDLLEMDVFSFLRLLRNDIPVILISSGRDLKLARKSLAEGATYFLEKPISEEDIKYLWQHVYRKMKNPKDLKIEKVDYKERFHDVKIQEESMQFGRDFSKRQYDEEEEMIESKRIKMNPYINVESIRMKEDEEEHSYDHIDRSISNKNRIVWTTELHRRFIDVLSKLGDEKARPKAVLTMMNDPSLSLRQVANHLKKYKSHVKSLQPMNGNSENRGGNGNKLVGFQPQIHEEVDESAKKGTMEEQIEAEIEKGDRGDSLQPLEQYADVLEVLEGNGEEINCFGSEGNIDVDRYCEWLRENLFEEDKDQVIM